MSESRETVPRPNIDYLVRMLGLNPMEQPDEIVRARIEYVGLASAQRGGALARTAGPSGAGIASAADGHAQLELRKEYLARIATVRTEFWNLPIAELNTALIELVTSPFPDLKTAASRLQIVAKYREQLLDLATKTILNDEFLESFKKILVLSPKEAAEQKEWAMMSVGNQRYRRRTRKVIKTIRKKLPHLYALEADWLGLVTDQNASVILTSGASRVVQRKTSESSRNHWLIVVAVIVLMNILRALFNSK